MQNLREELSHVIKRALKNEKMNEHVLDERAFFNALFENGLIGLVYETLDYSFFSKNFFDQMQKNYYAYIASDVQHLEAIKKIKTILNDACIDHIFLKGAHLKEIYPKTYMRAMGDIDILIKKDRLDLVHQIFDQHHIICKQKSIQHDSFKMDNITIEVHPVLYKDFNAKYRILFDDPWSFVSINETSTYFFSHAYELCYLLYHLAKHLDTSGIGLRSILDIGLYMKFYETKIDFSDLHQLLEKAEMLTFYHRIYQFNQNFFELSCENELGNPNLDEDTLIKLFDFFMTSGIHGLGKSYNSFTTRKASYQLRNKSRFLFYISLFFPSYETMLGMYPWLKKAKILIVFAWLLRWLKSMFKKRKTSMHKLKQLKHNEVELAETVKILKILDLK